MRLFRMPRARIVYEVENNSHVLTYGWGAIPARLGRLRPSDCTPNEKKNNGPDGGRDEVAPKIRHDVQVELLEQKAADNRADQSDRNIAETDHPGRPEQHAPASRRPIR